VIPTQLFAGFHSVTYGELLITTFTKKETMKVLLCLVLLFWAIPDFSMNKTVKNRHHDELINTASNNAYCEFGAWGSSDGEPVDAIIPQEWGRSVSRAQSEQEKLQEAIQYMQERRNKEYRHYKEECCQSCINKIPIAVGFTSLSALIYYCFSSENKQQ
jgi:hypothetical protein